MKYRNWIVALALISLALFLNQDSLAEFFALLADRERFGAYVASLGPAAPLAIVVVHFLHVLLAVIPGQAIIFSVGYVYGLPVGFLLNWLSIVAASQLAFWLSRRYGRPLVNRLAPAAVLDRWDSTARQHGFAFFFIVFLLPAMPGDTLNYLAGLTPLSGRRFFTANIVGRAPQLFVITWAGAYGEELASLGFSYYTWALIALVTLLIYLAWNELMRRYSPPPADG